MAKLRRNITQYVLKYYYNNCYHLVTQLHFINAHKEADEGIGECQNYDKIWRYGSCKDRRFMELFPDVPEKLISLNSSRGTQNKTHDRHN